MATLKKQPEKTTFWTILDKAWRFIGTAVGVLLWVGAKWEGQNDRLNKMETDQAIMKIEIEKQDEEIYHLKNIYYDKKNS